MSALDRVRGGKAASFFAADTPFFRFMVSTTRWCFLGYAGYITVPEIDTWRRAPDRV